MEEDALDRIALADRARASRLFEGEIGPIRHRKPLSLASATRERPASSCADEGSGAVDVD